MDKQITEGNKAIAEFMGCDPKPFKNEGGPGYRIDLNGVPDKGYMSYSLSKYGSKEDVINELLSWPLYYHTSWDWLMPVWIKFSRLGIKENKFTEWYEHKEKISVAILIGSIQVAHKYLSNGIKWYNQNLNNG